MNTQATRKGSDQTVRMCRLIWGLAGRLYHIVGNLMSRLICLINDFTYMFLFFVALRPKSTAMVMAGRSSHLTTLFPGQA